MSLDTTLCFLVALFHAELPIGATCVFFEERCYTQFWDWRKMGQRGDFTTVCITDEMVDKFLEAGIAEVDINSHRRGSHSERSR